MPELPEVELTRRALERWFKGYKLVRGEVSPKVSTVPANDIAAFEALSGKLVKTSRRGKQLLLEFDRGQGLAVHLGMTGAFVRRHDDSPVTSSRARLILDKMAVLHFVDPRMFGRLLPRPAAELPGIIADLGVDPLLDGLRVEQLREAIGASRQPLKVALMDQERIAGLGNLWTVEALFLARLHPKRRPDTLDAAEWKRLAQAIEKTLAHALDAVEEPDIVRFAEDDEARFHVYGRDGEPCKRCSESIIRTVLGGRATFFCPSCQPATQPQKPRRKGARP